MGSSRGSTWPGSSPGSRPSPTASGIRLPASGFASLRTFRSGRADADTVPSIGERNDELIERFYAAFAQRDGDAMAACYAPNARFSDPVFVDLSGEEPGAMWRMLAARATDLEVRLASHQASGDTGRANWIADYTFSTGRRVHNDVEATFRFENGLIVEHHDVFSFHAWARQALGPAGAALGWTPFLRTKVQRQARGQLDQFLARNG